MVAFLVCVVPYVSFVDAFNLLYGEGILWLLLIYFSGAYIRKYGNNFTFRLNPIIIGVTLCIIQFFIKATIAVATKCIFGQVMFSNALFGETPVLCYLAACFWFIGFKNLTISNNIVRRVIASCAPLLFSVFLIHENNNIKYHLWEIVNPGALANESPLLLWGVWLLTVVCLFAISFLIEVGRRTVDNKYKISISVAQFIIGSRLVRFFRYMEEKILNG